MYPRHMLAEHFFAMRRAVFAAVDLVFKRHVATKAPQNRTVWESVFAATLPMLETVARRRSPIANQSRAHLTASRFPRVIRNFVGEASNHVRSDKIRELNSLTMEHRENRLPPPVADGAFDGEMYTKLISEPRDVFLGKPVGMQLDG